MGSMVNRDKPSKQDVTYQAIFWPFIIGIVAIGGAVTRSACAGDEWGGGVSKPEVRGLGTESRAGCAGARAAP